MSQKQLRYCASCTTSLSRYNPSDHCAQCASNTSKSTIVGFWRLATIRDALAAGDLGTVLRHYRQVLKISQLDLANLLTSDNVLFSQPKVSRIEAGNSTKDIDELRQISKTLNIPPELLGLAPKSADKNVSSPLSALMSVNLEDDESEADVKRRSFLTGSAVLASYLSILGIGENARYLLSNSDRISMEHVRLIEQVVAQLEQQDQTVGANLLYASARQFNDRVTDWVERGSYSVSVGEALQTARGSLSILTGWLAIDANKAWQSDKYFHDAVIQARIIDDPTIEVRALALMCLRAEADRPYEALQIASAAQRVSNGWATPRLKTLLHLRAAGVYSRLQDVGSFNREVAKAKSQFEKGKHEDDLSYVGFMNEMELNGLIGLSYLDMNQPERAIAKFREVTSSNDPIYRRNLGCYTAYLAQATAQMGDISGACEIGITAIPLVSELESGRVTKLFTDLHRLAANSTKVAKAREFADIYSEVLAV